MNQSSELPSILIVYSIEEWHKEFTKALSKVANIIFAKTPDEAKKLLDEGPDISLLATDRDLIELGDGCEVVKYAKNKEFAGPIVAISYGNGNDALMEVGATHRAELVFAPEIIKDLVVQQ